MSHILVFDVGKTHIKLHLLDSALQSVSSRVMDNCVKHCAPYPHYDIDAIWQWLLAGIKDAAAQFSISAISISTHGATAALIDRHVQGAALVLPILDYEYAGIEDGNGVYEKKRPPFLETYSPDLPFGLNLGRQIHWQQSTFKKAFSQATDILLYPQYWAWRLSGKRCSEVSSLGCHTDLWSPKNTCFSSLVEKENWQPLFPKIVPAWTNLGSITADIQAQTGLNKNCGVFAGVHDSNASFLRYKKQIQGTPFTVISSGTWSILMASGVSLNTLQAHRDMLANVDVEGQPIACTRFMGGREFDIICTKTNTPLNTEITAVTVQAIIDSKVLALPDFSGGSGPLPSRTGEILGSVPTAGGAALASLYCALMLDYQLDLVKAQGTIFIEGVFLKNPWICEILAQLRPHQTIMLSSDTTGTVQGCAQLINWKAEQTPLNTLKCNATKLNHLTEYCALWRAQIDAIE